MALRLLRHTLAQGRTLVMGVLNVTPDSFSDGGRFATVEAAVEQARRLVAEGADLLDVGGESTRPGSAEVPAAEELRRILPVIERVRDLTGEHGAVPISVDTAKPEVADAALGAGAAMVNDVTGLGPEMLEVAARHRAAGIAMHMQGTPRTMQVAPRYDDVVAEVAAFLAERAAAAGEAGVEAVLDPGIGFGKTVEHNLELLRNLDRLVALGRPVLVGASRKAFLGTLSGAPVEERVEATAAAHTAAILAGAQVVRVHDVLAGRRAAAVADAIARARRRPADGRLVIAGLRCVARVGVSAEERSRAQELRVAVEGAFDPAPAALGDRFERTADYVAVTETVRAEIAARPRALLETLASEIGVALLARFAPLSEVRVRLAKPAVAESVDAAEVAVEATSRR
ncbi:MAG TPA: dihydropteroate synthase [Thermoanaerobaculia bacterium]|nr:dihydropteroate synthase [Thermoanaerobaculia bacterium]